MFAIMQKMLKCGTDPITSVLSAPHHERLPRMPPRAWSKVAWWQSPAFRSFVVTEQPGLVVITRNGLITYDERH